MFPGTESLSPRAAIQHMVTIYFVSHAVRAMAQLRLADHLASGPQTPAELAAVSGLHQSALDRFLRTLVGLGLCATENGHVRLSPLGELLRSDIPDSMRSFALAIAAPHMGRAWEELPEAIITGGAVFPRAHGLAFWDYLLMHPDEGRLFNAAMSGTVTVRSQALLAVVDLTSIRTLVDVGGGQGRLLVEALKAAPQLRGVLFDRPEVIPEAEATLVNAGLRDRCTLVDGNFFRYVPEGGDAYVLAQILHDWSDEDATAILQSCHRSMRPGARLWIVEQVIEQGEAFDRAKLLDLHMLVLFGAQERTAAEYGSLLEDSGFSELRVLKTETPWSVVEAQRV